MRVLVWQELFWPYVGGAEVLATKLFSALHERGYEITVVTRQDSPDLPTESEYQGIPIYRYPIWTALTGGDMDQIVQIRHQIAKLKRALHPDVIHMNSFGPSLLFHHDTAKSSAAPLLATLHSTFDSGSLRGALGENGLFKRTLRVARWVTAVSAAVLDQARQLVPEVTLRSSIIYNGVPTPSLSPTPLSFDAPRILCLGRIVAGKGFDTALEAFASVHDRFPRARLVIVGDGPARSDLEMKTVELGLGPWVEFLGWVPPEEVPALMNTATIVAIPSHWEALPSVALEAALMGRPVVATGVGGIPEIVIQEQTGLLVPPRDDMGLARAVLFLLENPHVARAFGKASRQRIQEMFGFERYVRAYDDLYQKITGQARAGTSELS